MSDSGKAYEWVDKQDQAALKTSPRVLAAESYLAGITSRDAEVESLQAELAEARAVLARIKGESATHYENALKWRDRAQEAQAVIEKMRKLPHGEFGPWDDDVASWDLIKAILDAAPSSALDARDAEKQAEALEQAADECRESSQSVIWSPPRWEIVYTREWLRDRAAVLREKGERQ